MISQTQSSFQDYGQIKINLKESRCVFCQPQINEGSLDSPSNGHFRDIHPGAKRGNGKLQGSFQSQAALLVDPQLFFCRDNVTPHLVHSCPALKAASTPVLSPDMMKATQPK